MAITITHVTDAVSASTTTTLTTSSVVTAAVGDWLVVVFASCYPNSGSATYLDSIVDSDGINSYTVRARVGYDPGGTNAGQEIVILTCAVTDALTSASITGNFNSGGVHDKTISVYRLQGSGLAFVAGDNVGLTGSATNHAANTVSVSSGNIIFGAASISTNDAITGDSDTTNGSWSTTVAALGDSTIDGTSTTGVSQYKTATGTGNQSWACSTTSARVSARTYVVIQGSAAAFTLSAALGQYTMTGTAMTPHLGNVPIVAGVGSYALTGTAATFINTGTTKVIAAGVGSYDMAGTDATLVLGHKLDATTAGSYALTGTAATVFRSLPMVAGLGSYALTGTDAVLTKASLTNKVLTGDVGAYLLTGTDATVTIVAAKSVVATAGSYSMAGTDAATTHQWKAAVTDVGSYVLTGTDVALATAANKVILALAGSYALTGTDVTLTAGVAPPSVSPLHIGEWPVDKKKRRAREDARAKEQRARDRFRRAIDRLLEGLPPEFDEPADLDEALDTAVQASNLLYAMSAPIREINAVNDLIDHIRQLRIAQPIAQLAMAQAYNQAHRHLKAKAQEDVVMTLLLGE